MRTFSFAFIASLAITGRSSPIGEAAVVPLAQRQTREGVHMGFCSGAGKDQTFVVWCLDDGNCNHTPKGVDSWYMTGYLHFEGEKHAAMMGDPDRAIFEWEFPAEAEHLPPFSFAGPGVLYRRTQANKCFRCSKDDFHHMFYDEFGQSCKSLYYCLPTGHSNCGT